MSRRVLAVLVALAVAALVLAAVATGGSLSNPPVLTISVSSVVEATSAAGADVSYSVVVTDDFDTLGYSCSGLPSGSTFPLGTSGISCTSDPDADGQTGSDSKNVTVQDTTAPTLSPSSLPDQPVTVGDTVSYTVPTATDIVDGSVTVLCSQPSGFTATVDTTVTCTATDAAGNPASVSFDVTVSAAPDNPPEVSISASSPVEATEPGGATVNYSVTVTDDHTGGLGATCNPTSGSLLAIGSHLISCTSDPDASNQTGSDSETVVVQDTTDPVVSVPSSMTVPATGPGGAPASYSPATATDNIGVTVGPDCSPPSGSTFPLGSNLVTCTAQDAAGNTGSNSFNISVQDANAPVITPPSNVTVEANGPGGAIAFYGLPSAVDPPTNVPIVATCGPPASGSLFSLGAHVVPCSATDGESNVGSASFTVTVQDTGPPTLTVPNDLTLGSGSSIPSGSIAIASWLSFVSAVDLVDTSVTITNNLPASIPLGLTAVTFTATDDSGNSTSATRNLSLVNPAQPGAASPNAAIPVSVQPDVAPGDVSSARGILRGLSVLLSWKLPGDADLENVQIVRTPGKRNAAESIVYKGKGTSFRDTSVGAGKEYRYLIVAYDKKGNHALGVPVVVLVKLQLLLVPGDGAKVKKAPRLKWKKAAGATYYNVQLYRGTQKLLSVWPKGTTFQLRSSWRYGGKAFKLRSGCYDWWVFPGRGSKAAALYGPTLGHSRFCVA